MKPVFLRVSDRNRPSHVTSESESCEILVLWRSNSAIGYNSRVV